MTPVCHIREPNGALIARIDGATTNYYHFDALGSTRFLTNGSGTVTDTYTYDAWGKQTASTGSTAQPYRYVGQLGYYSHYQDENLFDQSGYQFLQLGVRLYDALTGRFTQRDPIELRGESVYTYAKNSPGRRNDPKGLYAANDGVKVPTFVKELSCVNDELPFASSLGDEIAKATKYAEDVIRELSLEKCPEQIRIKCHGRCRVLYKNRCGLAVPHTGVIHLYDWSGCPRAMCVILHELVHACGTVKHDWVHQLDSLSPRIPCDFSAPYEGKGGH